MMVCCSITDLLLTYIQEAPMYVSLQFIVECHTTFARFGHMLSMSVSQSELCDSAFTLTYIYLFTYLYYLWIKLWYPDSDVITSSVLYDMAHAQAWRKPCTTTTTTTTTTIARGARQNGQPFLILKLECMHCHYLSFCCTLWVVEMEQAVVVIQPENKKRQVQALMIVLCKSERHKIIFLAFYLLIIQILNT
jgi:hypothetical protein